MKRIIPFLIAFISWSTAYGQVQTGKASFYADKFEGRPTASGERYKHAKLTAAHRTLPFGTLVKVTNLFNNRSVEVKINDRGPFVKGRIIDLSKAAARQLGFLNAGLTEVKLEVVDPGNGKGGSQIKTSDYKVADEPEFYDFNVEKVKPKGFGVQIGSYQELVNLVRLSQNLKSSYRKEVTVQVKVLNDVKVYNIILGRFPSGTKAEQFKSILIKKYPGAFTFDFSKV